jgi:hypothetical protein
VAGVVELVRVTVPAKKHAVPAHAPVGVVSPLLFRVSVEDPELPELKVTGETAVTLNPFTRTVTVALLIGRVPRLSVPVALADRPYLLKLAAFTEMVVVAVPPADRVTEVGLLVAIRPAGFTALLNVTVPAKPPRLVAVPVIRAKGVVPFGILTVVGATVQEISSIIIETENGDTRLSVRPVLESAPM